MGAGDDSGGTAPWWRRPILTIPGAAYAALLGVVLLARTGLRAYADPEMLRFARDFPTPHDSWVVNAVIGPALAHLVGAVTSSRWLLLHGALTAGVLWGLFLAVSRRVAEPVQRRLVQFGVSVSATPACLLGWIGQYDVYSAAGWLLIVVPGSVATSVCGGVLLGATNAEQGVLGLVSLALVSTALRRGGVRSWFDVDLRCVVGGAVGLVAARLAVVWWLRDHDVAFDGRADLFVEHASHSFRQFAEAGGLAVSAWYGLAWIAVAVLVVGAWPQLGPRRSAVLVVGLLALPGLASILTVDGTRVFAAIALPGMLVALGAAVRVAPEGAMERWARLPWPALLLVGLVPAVNLVSDGSVNLPWHLL